VVVVLLVIAGGTGWLFMTSTSGPEGASASDAGAQETPKTSSQTLNDFKGISWFVSPNGIKKGKGTKDEPMDLATALSKDSPAAPGDIVWLRGGTYKGNFVSELRGAEAAPILVRQSLGEHAVISAASATTPALTVKDSYVWFADFEIMNAKPERFASDASAPFSGGAGVQADAPHLKFIDLIVHDLQTGFTLPEQTDDIDVYGNLIYYNGWQRADDSGEGHGINTPNATRTRSIRSNIIFGQFGHGIYSYGAHTDNLVIEDNTLFNNGGIAKFFDRNILVASRALNLMLRRNMTHYSAEASAGIEGVNLSWGSECTQARVIDNYLTGGTPLNLTKCEPVAMRGNTLIGNVDPSYAKYGKSNTVTPGTGLRAFVTPNEFDKGRANITVFNWDRLPEVTVDLSPIGLKNGDRYEIRNAQNYYGPVVRSGVFDGKPISISLLGLTAAEPMGKTTKSPPATGRTFAALVFVNPQTAPPAAPSTQLSSR
jgi:hypothetical protein